MCVIPRIPSFASLCVVRALSVRVPVCGLTALVTLCVCVHFLCPSSRLSMSTRGAAEGTKPSVDLPPIPTTTIFVHISARVCGAQEFVEAHGQGAMGAFHIPPPPAAPPARADGLARTQSGFIKPVAMALAPGKALEAEAVLDDVLDALLGDLVRDAGLESSLHGLPTAHVPYFSELKAAAAGPGGPRAPAKPAVEPSDQASRLAALVEPETQDLIAKLLENTVLNLAREAAHGEFDPTAAPVTVLRRK